MLLAIRFRQRFPRTRGDRPEYSSRSWNQRTFPPHTRGSTQGEAIAAAVAEVSPAHAGIDPTTVYGGQVNARFPRTRGDRPLHITASDQSTMFPPHTRGSTHSTHASTWVDLVSPAHAGIDLVIDKRGRHSNRFPRTRGDRPPTQQFLTPATLFPPHTRGSTQDDHWLSCCVVVSPAHAGIDPETIATNKVMTCFPRTRGDRPQQGVTESASVWFPPHTRGSTLRSETETSGP